MSMQQIGSVMSKIVESLECKNSPKNARLQGIVISALSTSGDDVSRHLDDNVTLHLANGQLVEGKEAVVRKLAAYARRPFDVLEMEHAITHGRVGVANGRFEREGGVKGFCVVVEFVNTKAERLAHIKLFGM